MPDSRKQNASREEGAKFTKLGGGVNEQSKIFECSAKHISNLCSELATHGLALKSTSTETQTSTLLKVLKYLGPRGLGTYEGTAAGYARLATRVFELEEDGWLITSQRESLIGPDGLFHPGVARYVLMGRCSDFANSQMDLGLEVLA